MPARRLLTLLAAAAAAAAALPAAAAPLQAAPAAQQDWTQVVSETEGGYRMGNPDAPVKLVEYGSITCAHCGAFAERATEAVRAHVRGGAVSFEYRPFLIFPSDMGVFALLRCQGPGDFFPLVDALYATQREWTGRLMNLSGRQMQRMGRMSPAARDAFIVRATGLDALFRAHGMSQARIDSCLADQSGRDWVVDITSRAVERDQVQGTPTFLINGETVDAHDWATLEPRLRAAMGS